MRGSFWQNFERVDFTAQVVLALQVGCAALAGAIVGVEREWAGKRAGLRTHVIVAVASALSVGIGELVLEGRPGDATRVFHGVLTGVGFIGAGAILQGKKSTGAGLTTAATVLFVAVLGAVAAFGAPFFAIFGAVAGVVTLRMAHTLFERPLSAVRARALSDDGDDDDEDYDSDEGDEEPLRTRMWRFWKEGRAPEGDGSKGAGSTPSAPRDPGSGQ